MLLHSGLAAKYWEHALEYFIWIKNRTVTRRGDLTPYEQLWQEVPSLALAKVFGCMAQVQIPAELRKSKIEPLTKWGIFLGIPEGTKGWKFQYLDPSTEAAGRSAFFHEDLFYKEE